MFLEGTEKTIKYVLQTLTKTKKNYSQTERKVIFAVRKFHKFLRTDHKPLITIFNPSKATSTHSTNRLQR